MVAEIWANTSVPFCYYGLLVTKDPIEAAKVDGCNSWQVFKNITTIFNAICF